MKRAISSWVALWLAVVSVVQAETIVVTSNADSGTRTLRAALSVATAGTTITFNLPSTKRTTTLSEVLPTISLQNSSPANPIVVTDDGDVYELAL